MNRLIFVACLAISFYSEAQQNFKLTLQEGHTDKINDLVALKKSNLLLSCSDDKSVIAWDLRSRRQVFSLAPTGGGAFTNLGKINCIDVNQDETLLAIGFELGGVVIYDLKKRERITMFGSEYNDSPVNDIQFTRDSKQIVVGKGKLFRPNSLQVWDIATTKMLYSEPNMTGIVVAVDVLPDGKIASYCQHFLTVFSPDLSQKIAELEIKEDYFQVMRYVPALQGFLVGYNNVNFVSLNNNQLTPVWKINIFPKKSGGRITAVHPDLRRNKLYVSTLTGGETLLSFDLKTRKPLARYLVKGKDGKAVNVNALAVTNDSLQLAVASQRIELFYLASEKLESTGTLDAYSRQAVSISMNAKENWLLTTTEWAKTNVNVIDLNNANIRFSLPEQVNYPSLSRNSGHLIYVKDNETPNMKVRVVDVHTGKTISDRSHGESSVGGVAPVLTPDGTNYFVKTFNYSKKLYEQGKVEFVDIATGKILEKNQSRIDFGGEMRLSNNGAIMAYGADTRPTEFYNGLTGKYIFSINTGVQDVKVSPDGKRFIANGSYYYQLNPESIFSSTQIKTFSGNKTGAFHPTTVEMATTAGTNSVNIIEQDGKINTYSPSSSLINIMEYSPDGKFLILGNKNGSLDFMNTTTRKIDVSLIVSGTSPDYVFYTPDGYYYATKKATAAVHYVDNSNDKIYLFDQFDLKYNRPDIILKRLGSAKTQLIDAYHKAWRKRVRKAGLNPDDLEKNSSLEAPDLVLSLPQTLETKEKILTIGVKALDKKMNLKSLNIVVNGVPIFGKTGQDLTKNLSNALETNVNIALSNGTNNIDVFVQNAAGVNSLTESFRATYVGLPATKNLYIVAIGVSDYQNNEYDLNYAAKDAEDLVKATKSSLKNYQQVTPLLITNANATKQNILDAKKILSQSNVDDEVILFVAGHGLLDDNLDYYFATHDVNFDKPSENGLLYDDLEGLLDGIPARKKLMLIDACHSGEVDKEETQVLASATTTNETGVSQRGFKPVAKKEDAIDLEGSFELMKELFTDLRNGTGAIVIASASGVEFAFESADWKNGVFTYSVLEGLKTGKLDIDKNSKIQVSELKDYVMKRVVELTGGKQHPTSRTENLDADFEVW